MRIGATTIPDSDLGVNPNVTIAIGICVSLLFLAMYRSYYRPRTTELRGPPRNDFVFGVTKDIFTSSDPGSMYRNWEKTYGPVYEIPSTLGSTILVLQDPAATAHLCSQDTSTYRQTGFFKSYWRYLVRFSRTCEVILTWPLDRLAIYY